MTVAIVKPLALAWSLIAVCASPLVSTSYAQARPSARRAQPARRVTVNGYATFGRVDFVAKNSFEAITGKTGGTLAGGGVRVGLPWGNTAWGGPFIEIGAWRHRTDGERAFVFNGTVYKLGIPVEITTTPLELSAGWQFRFRRLPRLTPYVAGGLTSARYEETSSFSSSPDDVDEDFGGYHMTGGIEYRVTRWVGVAGEAVWSTVPNSIGQSGVSQAFNETNLGANAFRIKILIGR